MKQHFRKVRGGLTLIELIVVVAILAILAMIVLPKLDGLTSNANHAVGAVSADDTGRYIQIYRVTKNRYPDGWDSLTDGTDLWDAADPSTTTRGLHRQLSGTDPKLTTATLSATDLTALNNAGIYTMYTVASGQATSIRPGDMFNTQTPITDGATVAILNNATSGGKKMIDHIYRANKKAGGVSGTIPAGAKLVAFGFGPHNELIGKTVYEVPSYPNVDSTLIYNRNLVIFELLGTKCTMKAVTGSDGDLIDDLTASMHKDPG